MPEEQDILRRLRDLTTIAEIGVKLSSEIDAEAVAQLICFYGTVLLEAERATLYLLHEDRQTLEVKTAHGHPDAEGLTGRTFAGALVMQLATDEESRCIIVPQEQRRLFPFLDPALGGPAIVSSIFGKKGLVGVLAVEEKVDGTTFTDYDGETLERLVAQAGIAIENAGLLADLDQNVGHVEQELIAARAHSERLAEALLPDPALAMWRRGESFTPRRFDAATFMVARLGGFASEAVRHDPAMGLGLLGRVFGRFDELVAEHELERLAILGDTYVAASGVFTPRSGHAAAAAGAALAMVGMVREAAAGQSWQVRIGLSTGPGVVGPSAPGGAGLRYLAEAVNVAHQLSAFARGSEVWVSMSTYQLIDHAFECSRRDAIAGGGTGELAVFEVRGRRHGG